MTEDEKARATTAGLDAVRAAVDRHMDELLHGNVDLGSFASTTTDSRARGPREMVCQGCGLVTTLLYGRAVTCSCGVTSSAELLPPA